MHPNAHSSPGTPLCSRPRFKTASRRWYGRSCAATTVDCATGAVHHPGAWNRDATAWGDVLWRGSAERGCRDQSGVSVELHAATALFFSSFFFIRTVPSHGGHTRHPPCHVPLKGLLPLITAMSSPVPPPSGARRVYRTVVQYSTVV